MDPWVIAALIAAVIGVGTLASNAAAASLPRVTSWALVSLPTPGLNGQWDLWVTGLNGLQGMRMMALIPGGATDPNRPYLNMIYIPAATVQAQPTNADWTYTFTPRGQTQSMSIVVPAAVLQAYAAMPKTAFQRMLMQSMVNEAAAGFLGHVIGPQSDCSPQVVVQAIDDAQALIAKFPSNPSASDVLNWLAANAGEIATTTQEIVTATACAQAGDQGTLDQLKSEIESFAAKAGSAGLSLLGSALSGTSSSGTDQPSDQPSDQASSSAADQPSDQASSSAADQPTDSTS